MLDHKSPIPLYYQLEEEIRKKIEKRDWLPGATLPSERELCQIYGVSRGPVRQALRNLEAAGLVQAIQGKGVIVREKLFQPNLLANASLFKEIERQGMIPSAQVVKKEISVAPPHIIRQLLLLPADKILLLQRIIKGDDQPLALATTYLPLSLFPGILEYDLSGTALYDLITKVYKLTVDLVQEKFEPALPGKEEIALLGLIAPIPCLKVHRLILSRTRPVDYTIILVNGDRCLYTLEIPVNNSRR